MSQALGNIVIHFFIMINLSVSISLRNKVHLLMFSKAACKKLVLRMVSENSFQFHFRNKILFGNPDVKTNFSVHSPSRYSTFLNKAKIPTMLP